MTDQADPSQLPRRACTSCGKVLPELLDELEAQTLSVVGLNRAGKTYLLGTALNAATRGEGLQMYGVREFEPLEDTAERLHREYYRPIFRREDHVSVTNPLDHLEKSPLVFKVTTEGSKSFILVTHDISGEALMRRSARASTAEFVSRADALLLVADPVDMLMVERNLSAADIEGNALRDIDQGSLFKSVLAESARRSGRRPFVALTISKSDLIDKALHRTHAFSSNPTTSRNWHDDVLLVNEDVRKLLAEVGESRLVNMLEGWSSSFHAVSVLPQTVTAAPTAELKPVRVLEPFGMLISKLSRGLA